jgi:hypothetical protein
MNKIVPLWSIPRSISTGFERMMMERGDFKVIHEPFSYYFYQKAQGAAAVGMNVDPDHPQEYDEIVAMILREAEKAPVFFKDMSYHAFAGADEAFMSQFVNTFIIRHPKYTLVSGQKMNPGFTLEEAGYETQFKMFEMVKKITGEVPAIVDGEDLVEDAAGVVKQYCEKVGIPFLPESLTWEPEFKPEWKSWESWHLDAGKSTGFNRDMEEWEFTVDDVPRLKEMYEQCMPYYEKMYEVRLRP